MCSKALYSDDRLLFDIEISGKTQKYCQKSVCNFKVTRFYLILHSPVIFLSTYKLVPRGCDPFGQHQGSFRSSRIAKALGTRLSFLIAVLYVVIQIHAAWGVCTSPSPHMHKTDSRLKSPIE